LTVVTECVARRNRRELADTADVAGTDLLGGEVILPAQKEELSDPLA
jgi:hypothetical protein